MNIDLAGPAPLVPSPDAAARPGIDWDRFWAGARLAGRALAGMVESSAAGWLLLFGLVCCALLAGYEWMQRRAEPAADDRAASAWFWDVAVDDAAAPARRQRPVASPPLIGVTIRAERRSVGPARSGLTVSTDWASGPRGSAIVRLRPRDR